METNLFNLTQYIDMTKPPFPRSALDYSHLEYAEVLDAVGASALLLSLTALFFQFPSVVFGFSTRTLCIRSLFERSLILNAVLAANAWIRSSRSRQNYCFLISVFMIAGSLQLLLLAVEAAVVFSASPKIQTVSFEDLKFKNIQFVRYGDMPAPVVQGPDCVSFLNSQTSIVIPGNSLCVHQALNPRTEARTYDVKICLWLDKTRGEFNVHVITNESLTIRPYVFVSLRGPRNDPIFLNMTSAVDVPSDFTESVGQHIAKRYKCKLATTQHLFYSQCYTVSDCENRDDEEIRYTTSTSIISSIKLSNRLLSRNDFMFSDLNSSDPQDLHARKLSTSIDWDNFAQYRTSQVPGYWMWIGALIFFFANLLIASFAPDIQLAKAVAVAQYIPLTKLPLQTCNHNYVCLQLRNGIVRNHCVPIT